MIGWWWAVLAAEAAKTTKVEKALAAYEAGDTEGWTEARGRLDPLVAAAPTDPALRLLEARLWLSAASHGLTGTGAIPLERALVALEAVKGAEGEARARAETETVQLSAALVAELTNLVEGKQWADAGVVAGWCGRAQALAASLGQRDADRLAAYEKLATRVAVQAGDLPGARDHYARLVAATENEDPALAVKVARKIAEKDAPAAALDFLRPIAEAAPTDEALLRAWVDLALQAQQPDEALARVDAVNASLATSKSGAVLLGELYELLGKRDQARGAYEALLAAEPTNIPANVALARFWVTAAAQGTAMLDAEAAARKPTRETQKVLAAANRDLQVAEKHARAAIAADENQASSWTLLLEVLNARRALLPATAKTTEEKAAAAAVDDALATARAKLASLQESP